MQVTIIGSGNVATVAGRVLLRHGYRIVQVCSRNPAHAAQLAGELGAVAVSNLSLLNKSADLFLFAVTDDALPGVAAAVSLPGKLVAHTAGSISKEVLKKVSDRYGILWPMKMIRRSMTSLNPVTIAVDGSSATVIRELEELARVFSPLVVQAGDAQRLKMHMLATLTSNFTNHLYHLAADYCSHEGIEFSLFFPLIEETAKKIQEVHPKELQAGPAFRGDTQTLEKHSRLLIDHPQLGRLYGVLSDSIAQTFVSPLKPG